jgi:hypothetical protein
MDMDKWHETVRDKEGIRGRIKSTYGNVVRNP